MKAIITIDANEHSMHQKHQEKLTEQGFFCSVKSLDAGDFDILCSDGSRLLIERKTPRDLLESIKDGRLFNQVASLVGVGGAYVYLLIEGLFITHYNQQVGILSGIGKYDGLETTNWEWASLQGALLSVQEMGCHIVYDANLYSAITRLVNRSRNEVKVAPRQREAYIFDERESVLMSLPGIGSSKALDLLKQFPELANVLAWLTHPEWDEPKVKGIGKKTRERIRVLFGSGVSVDYE